MKNLILVVIFFAYTFVSYAQISSSSSPLPVKSIIQDKKFVKNNIPTASPKGNVNSVKDGIWSDSTVWNTKKVPTENDNVVINNNVLAANADFQCYNLSVNRGCILEVYTTWYMYVLGNLSNNGMIYLDTGSSSYNTMLIIYGNLTNSNRGVINAANYRSTLYFAGSSKQTFTNSGTINGRINNLSIDNPSGLSLASGISAFRVNLFDGSIINSNRLTLGDGQTGVIQRGGNPGDLSAGYLDKAPAFNLGSNPNLYLIYYTALPITTGYEIPSGGQVYYMRSTNAQNVTLNSDITITNALSLDSGQFNISAHTLTINNGSIIKNNGTISGGSTSNITFTGSTAAALPEVMNGIKNLTINNSGNISLSGNNTILNSLTLTNGLLNTGGYTLTFANSASNPVEKSSSRIVGTAIMASRNVGTASIYFLNCRIAAGTSSIGNVTITRTTGSAITIVGNSGIQSSWNVSTSIASPQAARNITYEWLSNYDNNHIFNSSNKAQIYKSSDGSNWSASGNLADVSVSNPRSITTAGESPAMRWTVTSQDSPLPVTLASFSANVTSNNVVLKWRTSEEINNSGFDIERCGLNDGKYVKIGFVKGNGTTKAQSDYSFADRNLNTGKYQYRLKQIDNNGNFEYHNLSGDVNILVPAKFELKQNYPNPFNPETGIDFSLPYDGKVKITVFDITGKELSVLLNELQTAGYHSIRFNGSNISSGVYFYKMDFSGNGNSFSQFKRMVLLK